LLRLVLIGFPGINETEEHIQIYILEVAFAIGRRFQKTTAMLLSSGKYKGFPF
jgi:hypothetical protein